MKHLLASLFLITVFAACGKINLAEKNVAVPGHAWASNFQPKIQFDIKDDTATLYNIYVVLRHNDAYRYKNIWMDISVQPPGDSTFTNRRELILANDAKGWLGTGMDDLFEHRILLTDKPTLFSKKGTYTFTLKQIMREDPLENILNVGIRIEKAKE